MKKEQRFSIRKFSVGTGSILLGTALVFAPLADSHSSVAYADENTGNEGGNTGNPVVDENGNVVPGLECDEEGNVVDKNGDVVVPAEKVEVNEKGETVLSEEQVKELPDTGEKQNFLVTVFGAIAMVVGGVFLFATRRSNN